MRQIEGLISLGKFWTQAGMESHATHTTTKNQVPIEFLLGMSSDKNPTGRDAEIPFNSEPPKNPPLPATKKRNLLKQQR